MIEKEKQRKKMLKPKHDLEITEVINDIQNRFPNCGENYTVKILLWTDGTSSVECRHGRVIGDKAIVGVSRHYNEKLIYYEETHEL